MLTFGPTSSNHSRYVRREGDLVATIIWNKGLPPRISSFQGTTSFDIEELQQIIDEYERITGKSAKKLTKEQKNLVLLQNYHEDRASSLFYDLSRGQYGFSREIHWMLTQAAGASPSDWKPAYKKAFDYHNKRVTEIGKRVSELDEQGHPVKKFAEEYCVRIGKWVGELMIAGIEPSTDDLCAMDGIWEME